MNSMLSFSVMFSNIPLMIKVRALCQILEAAQDWLTGQVRGVHKTCMCQPISPATVLRILQSN